MIPKLNTHFTLLVLYVEVRTEISQLQSSTNVRFFADKESGKGYKSVRVCPQNSDASWDVEIDFQPVFWNPQMLSFPNMYNTMGSKVDGLAVRDHVLSKSA